MAPGAEETGQKKKVMVMAEYTGLYYLRHIKIIIIIVIHWKRSIKERKFK